MANGKCSCKTEAGKWSKDYLHTIFHVHQELFPRRIEKKIERIKFWIQACLLHVLERRDFRLGYRRPKPQNNDKKNENRKAFTAPDLWLPRIWSARQMLHRFISLSRKVKKRNTTLWICITIDSIQSTIAMRLLTLSWHRDWNRGLGLIQAPNRRLHYLLNTNIRRLRKRVSSSFDSLFFGRLFPCMLKLRNCVDSNAGSRLR